MKEKIAIFDLDGTLVDITHRLHYIVGEKKEWNTFFNLCDKDKVKENIRELCVVLYLRDYAIFIITGRSEKIREKTIKFLDDHWIPFDKLLMRREGDHRPDYIVKKEIFDSLPAEEKSKVKFVFEDRSSVVKMWRETGLTCFQVEEGNF